MRPNALRTALRKAIKSKWPGRVHASRKMPARASHGNLSCAFCYIPNIAVFSWAVKIFYEHLYVFELHLLAAKQMTTTNEKKHGRKK